MYNIADFEIEFSTNQMGFRITNKVFYAGTSFFKELKSKTTERILLNREVEFKGSVVHFMRSLASEKLSENKFQVYFENSLAPPYKHLILKKEDNLTKVHITANKLVILYNNSDQSGMQPVSEDSAHFIIDKNGTHSPFNNILFSGVFGQRRISSILPLNYIPSAKP